MADEIMTAYRKCRCFIGAHVCGEMTDEHFTKDFVDTLIGAPLRATVLSGRGMPLEYLELLLPYLEFLESRKGVRLQPQWINDGKTDAERQEEYESTAAHALNVCAIIRNNYRHRLELRSGPCE